jgi:hypothetical protein
MHSFSIEFEYAEWKKVFELRNFNSYWDSIYRDTTNINSIAVMGAEIYVATGQGVILSSDNFKTWCFANNGFPENTNVEALAISETIIFAATDRGVFLSSDNGANWVKLNHDLLEDNAVNALAINGTNILLGTENCVLLSTDNGTNWVVQNAPKYELSYNGIRLLSLFGEVEFLAMNGTNILAAAFEGLFFSPDNGINWTEVNNGLPENARVISLAISETNIFAGTNGGGVYLSLDNGANWKAVNNGLPVEACVDSLVIHGTCIFAGIYKSGVFFSTDNGENWTAFKNDFPAKARINSLIISGNYIFAGTENQGLWKSTLREIDKIFVKSYHQAELEILDIQGHLIESIDVNKTDYIDVSDLPNGLFNVKIKFSHPHNMLNPNETDMSIYVNL